MRRAASILALGIWGVAALVLAVHLGNAAETRAATEALIVARDREDEPPPDPTVH